MMNRTTIRILNQYDDLSKYTRGYVVSHNNETRLYKIFIPSHNKHIELQLMDFEKVNDNDR